MATELTLRHCLNIAGVDSKPISCSLGKIPLFSLRNLSLPDCLDPEARISMGEATPAILIDYAVMLSGMSISGGSRLVLRNDRECKGCQHQKR